MKLKTRRSASSLSRPWPALVVSALTLGACVTLSGCEMFGGESSGCVSTRDYFEDTAWPQVLGQICTDCHTPGGQAGDGQARFELLPPGYPGFIDTNLERIRQFARMEYDGTSVLLLKPLGELDHGGGRRFKKGSDEYEVLERLVQMAREGDSCEETITTPEYDDVEQLSATATFRKAALHLAYRLPTASETEELADAGEEALPDMIDDLLEEDAFYARIKDIFNDRLLTDRYLNYTGYAVNQLNEEMYPKSGVEWEELEDEALRQKINRGLAREPLEFVVHLLKNDRPFTEIVTADYTVVNPFSAPYYNAEAQFADPTDENEFVQARRRAFIDGALVDTPHAGILTSPMWLNRYPTTPTNRNRHRARMVLEIFLATDILKVGDRPLDPTAATRYANPTRDDPSCSACHKVIDPLAGTFQKYDDYDPERYRPEREWHNDMDAPGFGKEEMTVEDFGKAPEWTAKHIATDPRFVQAMIRIVYQGLTGRPALEYPADTKLPHYAASLVAWNAQDSTFRLVGEKFVESNYNLKVVLRELVLSPYFRAAHITEKPDAERAVELAEIGTERLSTPMLLARKIEAVTGIPWTRGWDQNDQLMTNFHILYGGIDSETINKRLSVPNGVMASVQWRMANEVSCNSVATDFNKPKDARTLFRKVELDDFPETDSGDAIPAAVSRIKDNIRYLHAHVLGQELAEKDPEIERTYRLFLDTWKEGKQLLAAETVGNWLVWQCQARVNPETGEELPEEQRLNQDPNYTVRAWMAVVTYLLSDYEFLYE